MNDNIVASNPITKEDILKFKNILNKQADVIRSPMYTVVPILVFDRLMILAKYYKTGTQFIKRNYHTKSKKNRYTKTFRLRHLKIIDSKCLESYDMKIVPAFDII